MTLSFSGNTLSSGSDDYILGSLEITRSETNSENKTYSYSWDKLKRSIHSLRLIKDCSIKYEELFYFGILICSLKT